MKKYMFIVAMAMVACGENNNNVNPNNNTNNPEISCADGMDNDLDGLVDCNDSDCASNQACITAPNCGNGLIDPDEECDGPDLNGASCESLQLGTGTLTCNECAYDTRGCSNNNALKIYQSGTRMKMRVGTTPDGSKEFKGWYDSQLNINCVFRKLTTGLTRCIPELTSLNDRWYSDSSCTTRLAVLHAEDEDLHQFDLLSMEISTGVWTVVQVTGRVTQSLYTTSDGICTMWGRPSAAHDVYSVTQSSSDAYQGQEETVE